MLGEWFNRGKNNEPQDKDQEQNPWDSLRDVKPEDTQIDKQDVANLKVIQDPGYSSPERAAELDAAKNMNIDSSASMADFVGIKMGLIGNITYFQDRDSEEYYDIEDYEQRRIAFAFLTSKAAELDKLNTEHLQSERSIPESEKAQRIEGVNGKYIKSQNIYDYLRSTYNLEPDGDDYPYTILIDDREIARQKEEYKNAQEAFGIEMSFDDYRSLSTGDMWETRLKISTLKELAKKFVNELYEEQQRRRNEGVDLDLEQGATYWVNYSPEEIERAQQEQERQAARESAEQTRQTAFADAVEKYKTMESSELDAEIQRLEESLRAARQARQEQSQIR